MCIILRPLLSVSNTNILLALLKDGNNNYKLLNLYGNKVQLSKKYPKNAMILPVPAEGKSIELIDSSEWGDKVLDSLRKACDPPKPLQSDGSRMASKHKPESKLAVVEVG